MFLRSIQPLKTEALAQDPSEESDENLGPIEPPFPSAKYQRNITFSLLHVGLFIVSVYFHDNSLHNLDQPNLDEHKVTNATYPNLS